MAIFSITNLQKIFKSWERLNVKQYLIMNLLILINIGWKFGYSLDGPLQLISEDDAISVPLSSAIQIVSICFMNINFAYSSYLWIELILIYKGIWNKPKVAGLIKSFFGLNIAFIGVVAIFDVTILLTRFKDAYSVNTILLSVTTLINGFIFAGTCYKLGISLAEIYNFDAKMAARVGILRVLALVVAICSLLRIANDLVVYGMPDWQQEVNLRSYCARTFGWSAYIFFFCIVADVIPLTFFLLLFRPGTSFNDSKSRGSSVDANMFLEKSLSSNSNSSNHSHKSSVELSRQGTGKAPVEERP